MASDNHLTLLTKRHVGIFISAVPQEPGLTNLVAITPLPVPRTLPSFKQTCFIAGAGAVYFIGC